MLLRRFVAPCTTVDTLGTKRSRCKGGVGKGGDIYGEQNEKVEPVDKRLSKSDESSSVRFGSVSVSGVNGVGSETF